MTLAVFTALDDHKAARDLARSAVDRGLAACVQINEITSVYSWKGKVEEGREWRLLFKTSDAAYEGLTHLILGEHPYDEPALWSYKIEGGSRSYLNWIDLETEPDGSDPGPA